MDSVMKRLGFVKLQDYGLVLTPEGRILSIRPAILDDRMGGRIVGWKDDDLVSMELEPWAVRPAPPAAVAPRVAVAPAPVPAVAAAPNVEEDDWEWTIAIARARATAEETEVVLAAVTRPTPRRMRADTLPPPVVADPIAADVWPSTETLTELDFAEASPSPATSPPVVATPAPFKSIPAPAKFVQSKPAIPIPTLPSATTAKLSPVVRRTGQIPVIRQQTAQLPIIPSIRQMPTPIPPQQPRRFAKGTMPVTPTTISIMPPAEATLVNVAVSVPSLPSLMLSSSARAKLPSVLRKG